MELKVEVPFKPYYQDESVTIYNADCRQVLPFLPKFDLLLTDPPYGIGASAGTGKYGRLKFTQSDTGWDSETSSFFLLHMAIESAKYAIVWGGNYFQLPPSRRFLVWDKGAGFKGRDFAECEQAWCSFDGNAKVFQRDPLAAGDYRCKVHPTQKPVALMQWCCAQVGDNIDTVLDPFAGSGTTGLACKLEGRKATLIEISEQYCESAAKRLEQGVLF